MNINAYGLDLTFTESNIWNNWTYAHDKNGQLIGSIRYDGEKYTGHLYTDDLPVECPAFYYESKSACMLRLQAEYAEMCHLLGRD